MQCAENETARDKYPGKYHIDLPGRRLITKENEAEYMLRLAEKPVIPKLLSVNRFDKEYDRQ